MSLLHFLLGFIPTAYAQVLTSIGTASPGVSGMWEAVCSTVPFCGVGRNAPLVLGLKIINFLLMMIGGTAVAVIIYAGIKLIISRGNDEGLTEAKKIAGYAAAGLILATVADAVVNYAIYLVNIAAR